jgi:hypothetical protein
MSRTAVLAFVLSLGWAPAVLAEDGGCLRVKEAIRDLGAPYFAEDETLTIRQLHPCASQAVPLLIAELKVVDPESENEREWWHAVWCERALRSITGEYFAFRSSQSLGRLGEFKSKHDKVGYVSEWMSRGRVYMAPRDVQARVIAAWKAWQLKHRDDMVAKPFVEYGDWYW